MYANLSNDIDDPSGFNYSYKLVKPISIQTSFNLNSFSLSNIADGINPADACAYHQLTDYKSSNDSALATIASNLALEASRADTVEKNLASDLSKLTQKATDSESTLKDDIQQKYDQLLRYCKTLESTIDRFKSTEMEDVRTLQSNIDELQAQLTVQSGYITQVYKYIWDTAPSVVPNR